jgi:hypothetical protein
MPVRPLVETNPYLKDPGVRAQLLALAVSTSTSIETIHAIDPRDSIPVKKFAVQNNRPEAGAEQ